MFVWHKPLRRAWVGDDKLGMSRERGRRWAMRRAFEAPWGWRRPGPRGHVFLSLEKESTARSRVSERGDLSARHYATLAPAFTLSRSHALTLSRRRAASARLPFDARRDI